MAKPQLQVIQGGTGGRAANTLIDTAGTADRSAEPKLKRAKPASGGGRGGGSQAVAIGKLEQSLASAWKVIVLLAAAFGGAFLFFLLRIDDRFDRVDEPMGNLTTNVAVQGKAITGIERSLDRIETRLNTQPPPDKKAGQ